MYTGYACFPPKMVSCVLSVDTISGIIVAPGCHDSRDPWLYSSVWELKGSCIVHLYRPPPINPSFPLTTTISYHCRLVLLGSLAAVWGGCHPLPPPPPPPLLSSSPPLIVGPGLLGSHGCHHHQPTATANKTVWNICIKSWTSATDWTGPSSLAPPFFDTPPNPDPPFEAWSSGQQDIVPAGP